jgi:hypothetical protein
VNCPAARFQVLKRALRVANIGRASVGQLDCPAGAVEQLHAQCVFQLPDLLRQRRLRHMQRLGRAREITVFRDRQKITDVPQQHGASLNYWCFLCA